MQDFEINTEIKHINVRKEGEEKEVLAMDLKLSAIVDADLVDALMCEDINDGECQRCFWTVDGAPRFANMPDVSFSRMFASVSVDMMMLSFTGCRLSKFSFSPMSDSRATLVFTVSIKEPPAMAVDRLASMLMNSLPAKFWMPQGDLVGGAR